MSSEVCVVRTEFELRKEEVVRRVLSTAAFSRPEVVAALS